MKNSYLQPVAKKLQKRSNKIIYADWLKDVIKSIMKENYTDKRAYKIIYHLKNKGFLISLKKTIFFIKKPSEIVSDELLVEDWYWTILHWHCVNSLWKNRYIWWIKALELNFANYDIPDEILVVWPNKQWTEVVIWLKTVNFKKYTSKKTLLFPLFKKFTNKMKLWRYSYTYANKELALLESLYNFDQFCDRYEYEIIKKTLKKTKDRDISVWEKIMKAWKHHSSINRLYDIAKKQNPALAERLLISIKKYSFVLDI